MYDELSNNTSLINNNSNISSIREAGLKQLPSDSLLKNKRKVLSSYKRNKEKLLNTSHSTSVDLGDLRQQSLGSFAIKLQPIDDSA